MSAKSAPQLVSPLNHARSSAMHVRGTLSILALALIMASSTWMLDQARPELLRAAPDAERLASGEPALAAAPAAPAMAQPEAVAPAENRRHRALSDFLAKRYKVSQAVTLDLVTMAHA